MNERILIFDFGSQVTQLIGRRLRSLHVYCEIIPYNAEIENWEGVKGIILAGSPFSVKDEKALQFPIKRYIGKWPILGICYGAQYIAQELGGEVERSKIREYGRANLKYLNTENALFKGFSTQSQVWMSHGDSILKLPQDAILLADTENIPVAAYQLNDYPVFGIQFHPEVTHTLEGTKLLENFVVNICGCHQDWTEESFIHSSIDEIRETIGDEKVILALSGGVDSSVTGLLLHKAIGKQLTCIFVNSGLLRLHEYEEVLKGYESLGLNVIGVDASEEFLNALKGKDDPEDKRKAIGKTFIDVFQREAGRLKDVNWLAQGTIYPDVIESVSVYGPSAKIKSHHNVGGLPKEMHLKLIEPMRKLFKDEVRRVGAALELPDEILHRHPFPGPGLAIRILGEVTAQKVELLQQADNIFIQGLKDSGLYDEVWQAGVILLPVRTVGVMGDERTYENAVALRAVSSIDGMTADWSHLPHEFLGKISLEIINKVKGVNRVVYDISSKPPATIEWE